jgi:hypothetical protein
MEATNITLHAGEASKEQWTFSFFGTILVTNLFFSRWSFDSSDSVYDTLDDWSESARVESFEKAQGATGSSVKGKDGGSD